MVNIGEKFPESPNTDTDENQRTNRRTRNVLLTYDLVIVSVKYPRHGYFNSAEKDIEVFSEDH